MFPFGAGQTITLHTRVVRVVGGVRAKDAYGALIYDDVNSNLVGIAIWPESATDRGATEDAQPNQNRTNTVYVAAIPADTAIDAIDRLTWRGKLWEVQGEPQLFDSPFTGVALQTIRFSRVEG